MIKQTIRIMVLALMGTYGFFLFQNICCELSPADQTEIIRLQQCISQDPYDLQSIFSIGNIMAKNGNMATAEIYYQKVLEQLPTESAVLLNMAYAVRWQGKLDLAIDLYQRELTLNPNKIDAHFGLAQAYLLGGNFTDGLREFELGRQNTAGTTLEKIGDIQTIAGKRILIQAEWGLGDMLQFIRYARLLKNHGAIILVQTPDALIPLFNLLPYLDAIIPLSSGMLPDHDYRIPLLSLPYQCGTTLETIPAEIPYMHADQALIELWRMKLADDKNLRIGLCWQGSTFKAFPEKNIPLELFYPLAKIPGISLYSLQKLAGSEQLTARPNDLIIHDFGQDFDTTHGRFMDTAAVMKNLDLIITIDTSIAHLAGALGVNVWLALPHVPDWRWMLGRNDSPWYPTMRLFRQKTSGNWLDVIHEITTEIQGILNKT